MAKQTNEDIKVIVVSLENNDSKLKRLGVALRDSIKNGYWIVVENVHILDTWPKDVLKLLYVFNIFSLIKFCRFIKVKTNIFILFPRTTKKEFL